MSLRAPPSSNREWLKTTPFETSAPPPMRASASPLAAGSIRVGGERAGDEVRFSISDSGCGIPSNMLEAAFERFLAGRQQRSERGGPRLVHLQVCRRRSRRQDLGGQQPGRRQHLFLHGSSCCHRGHTQGRIGRCPSRLHDVEVMAGLCCRPAGELFRRAGLLARRR